MWLRGNLKIPALCPKMYIHFNLSSKKGPQMTFSNWINFALDIPVLKNKIIQSMNLLQKNECLFQNHDPLPHDSNLEDDSNDDL